MDALLGFQSRFINAATGPGVDVAALSLPRGNGKSALAGHLVTRVLSPDDPLFRPGTESVLCAASIEQARIVFRFARAALEPRGGYRFLDSHTRIGITHKATNTRLRVIGSNGKTAMGLVNCPWAICDEPGCWEIAGGRLLWDAIETAQGKPDSPLRALLIGTLAPLATRAGHWYHDLIAGGCRPGVHVMALQGNPERWDSWPEIRRCNPLMARYPASRKKLLAERDAARADSRLKARFLSYRLNVPSGDENEMLLMPQDWRRVLARPELPRAGPYVLGVDLGAGRAWSAAVACWLNGRVDALAVCPGIPDMEAQEKRDRVPRGVYQGLIDRDVLQPAQGLRVPPPGMLVDWAVSSWGPPAMLVCDYFREPELRDSCPGSWVIEPRRTLWSNASEDIRGLRKMALDGDLQCGGPGADLLTASLAAAMVENDTSGNVRMIKRGTNNQERDDVAAALILAAGAVHRYGDRLRPARPRRWALAG